MVILILGLVVFLGMHSVSIVARPWRDTTVARIGEGPWKGLYTVASLAGFALIVWGYGLARQNPIWLYVPPTGLRHLALLLMVPVFPLLIAAYLSGRIQRATKHPMLLATKLWALAHLLANGTLADVLLFGGFLVWAGLDRMSVKRRQAGPGSPTQIRIAPGGGWLNDAIAVLAGLVLYLLFVRVLHVWLIGVPPV